MRGRRNHVHSLSGSNNQRAQLATAYQELGKELASEKIRVVGNYTLGKVIGEGTYGKVRLGTHRLTSTRVAIKQIPKALSAQLTREIHHHRRLHHPNVALLYEVIATESSIWLVTELCSGGELFDYLLEKGKLSEDETRRIFGELCLGLNYVHENGAVHRDLKLENVLLDERCHVKLGDFGFAREFEHGRMLETFCGTTGYAAPEMLLGKKYMGQEVDIWSLGIILYALLCGTLPFDDEDENVTRDKILSGKYEEMEWLSEDARDLIRNILQLDPSKRLTIPLILNHSWFTSVKPISVDDVASYSLLDASVPPPSSLLSSSPPDGLGALEMSIPRHSSEPSTSTIGSTSTYHSATSDITSDSGITTPTTPGEGSSQDHSTEIKAADEAEAEEVGIFSISPIARQPSEVTIRKGAAVPDTDPTPRRKQPGSESVFDAVPEEDFAGPPAFDIGPSVPRPTPILNVPSRDSHHPHQPSPSLRTPIRTKRRSVTSTISPPSSPTTPPLPASAAHSTPSIPSYASLLSSRAPLAFSTPLEQDLLTSLSDLGFDSGQIAHSVLTDACDASGAIWWMLKRKREKEERRKRIVKEATESKSAESTEVEDEKMKERERARALAQLDEGSGKKVERRDTKGKQREKVVTSTSLITLTVDSAPESMTPPDLPSGRAPLLPAMEPAPKRPPLLSTKDQPEFQSLSTSASVPPGLSFIPPTPVSSSHSTPHVPNSPNAFLSPMNGSLTANPTLQSHTANTVRSTPPSPNNRDNKARMLDVFGKPRSSSVSMLQRAAGLVRKKSGERVPGEREERGKEKVQKGSKEAEGRGSGSGSADDSRGSSSSQTSNRLTKSPPSTAAASTVAKDASGGSTSTTPSHSGTPPRGNPLKLPATPGSPWVLPTTPIPGVSYQEQTPSSGASPSISPSAYLPNGPVGVKARNRTSFLSTLRTWLNDDRRRSKVKPVSLPVSSSPTAAHMHMHPQLYPYTLGVGGDIPGSGSRRGSMSTPGTAGKRRMRTDKRASVSSRRSSSVNSRRSSVTSAHRLTFDVNHPVILEGVTPQRGDPGRRSAGASTPTSEKGEFSSRPSSVYSLNPVTPGPRPKRHSKSLSNGSAGSTEQLVLRTASPLQQYHRRGGSGSSTKVVRQIKTVHTHIRTASAASSVHSMTSSRPGSYHEGLSESEMGGRTRSPSRQRSEHSGEDRLATFNSTVLVAQKKQSPFGSHRGHGIYASGGRSSWKKAWGIEPPGWATRSTQSPIEDLSDTSAGGTDFRDVFSSRPSLNLGDDSDWVDEDDDPPLYLGGLGQTTSQSSKQRGPISGGLTGSPAPSRKELPTFGPVGRARMLQNPKQRVVRSPGLAPTPDFSWGAGKQSSGSGAASSLVTQEVLSTSDPVGPRGRRQLPAARNGPAFRGHAIQEEDEDEGED